MPAMLTNIETMPPDQIVELLRGLVADLSDDAAVIQTAALARLARTCTEDFYVAVCDELYGAWG
jgi:hypothetical protein